MKSNPQYYKCVQNQKGITVHKVLTTDAFHFEITELKQQFLKT